MEIVDFREEYIEAACKLAKNNYIEECASNEELPDIKELNGFPSFEYVTNSFGVAAFEEGVLVGFLCCFPPFEGAFDTPVSGAYSPLFAHGTVRKNRWNIYRKMYRAYCEKLVANKVLYHAITLYENDNAAKEAFYRAGFGMRCVDAVRMATPLSKDSLRKLPGEFSFREAGKEDNQALRPLRHALSVHLSKSPCFLSHNEADFNEWLQKRENDPVRVFVASRGTEIVAYVEIREEGENFVTAHPLMQNICGAYCIPELRGTGLFDHLLNLLLQTMEKDGVKWVGVDFESLNQEADGYWRKHFSSYTCSVTRRLDDCALLSEQD